MDWTSEDCINILCTNPIKCTTSDLNINDISSGQESYAELASLQTDYNDHLESDGTLDDVEACANSVHNDDDEMSRINYSSPSNPCEDALDYEEEGQHGCTIDKVMNELIQENLAMDEIDKGNGVIVQQTTFKVGRMAQRTRNRAARVKSIKKYLKGTGSKMQECTTCKKMIKRSEITRHVKHTQSGPQTCTQCGKSFISLGSFKQHTRRQHGPNSGIKKWECTICHRFFKLNQTMKQHVKNIHAF